MTSALFLVFWSIVVRALAALLRRGSHPVVSFPGWMLVGIAGWLWASAGGAWTPFLAGLIPALLGAYLASSRHVRGVAALVDGLAVVITGLLSVPILSPVAIGVFATAAMAVGGALDFLIGRWLRIRTWLSLILLAVVAGAVTPSASWEVFGYLSKNMDVAPVFGITPALKTERVLLPGGRVAWVDRPRGTPRAGALFFHGYLAGGSHQTSSVVVRRALLANGFLVVSVDYPGFGESPAPAVNAPIEKWDPLPGNLAAYDLLRARIGDGDSYVIGHSMGAVDVVRFLATDNPPKGAVIMGAILTPAAPVTGDAWYRWFCHVYQFRPPLPVKRFAQIAARYHDKESALADLPKGHAPLMFVNFSKDLPAARKNRDAFYRLIGEPKSRVTCDASPTFEASYKEDMLMGNPLQTRRMSEVFRVFTEKR